ncbi:MAG TPA: hypothetical protein VJ436_04540 [Anaerolineales bacterium]|nr:hypothetical protein [Anaerolineales bacterium]
MSQLAAEKVKRLDVEDLRRQAMEAIPGPGAGSRELALEVAGLRVVLSRMLELALQAARAGQLIHLADLYGQQSIRLMRLLVRIMDAPDRLEAYLQQQIDRAIREVGEEWNPVA